MKVLRKLGYIPFFQAEHALYTPGLDENRGSRDFVHDIWICSSGFTAGYKILYTTVDTGRAKFLV